MRLSSWGRRVLAGTVLAVAAAPGEATAQAPAVEPDTYLDAAAAELHQAASRGWREIDESVVRYTATVRQRIAARLRTPLKDRTLYRNESAARVLWDRDHETLVQALGARARYPGRDMERLGEGLDFLDDLTIEGGFDPGADRLAFGFDTGADEVEFDANEGEYWFAHPLAPGADSLYRYRSGDTLTLSLPDGRALEVVKLDVLPRVADVHRMSGSLWIEPESGALVRAVYRLSDRFDVVRDVPDVREEDERGEFRWVPGLLKPWTFDLNMVAVDYALWDFRVWLPRTMRVEVEAAAGILKVPMSFDVAYRMESVVLEDDLPRLAEAIPVTDSVHFETRAEAMAYMARLASQQGVAYRRIEDAASSGRASRYLVPEDRSVLEASDALPPPIWDDAAGFQSEEDLHELFDGLADLPAPPTRGIPWAANWGFQRPDLVRYNRVEGPALGGRFQARLGSPVGPLSLEATGFVGIADLEPKARLGLDRESLRRRVGLSAYRDIRAVDPRGRFLGFGNSLNALLFGRDDGEYYRATGADLTVTPPSASREHWRLRLHAERQEALDVETSFSVAHAFDSDWRFRPNVVADELDEVGAELTVSPWWGTDPLAAQFGLDLTVQGGWFRRATSERFDEERGDWSRARLVARAALPIDGGRWRVGLEAAGGTSWGTLPLQRHWFLGGPLTLRGYGASTAVGEAFARGRLEVARVFPAWTLSVFGDSGWAGERDAWRMDDALHAVGVGASALDGLIRLDLSRGLTAPLRDTRLDLYLDAIL